MHWIRTGDTLIAHFKDHKSLAFTFSDLLAAGFAADDMDADFGTPPALQTIPDNPVGFSRNRNTCRESKDAPRSPGHLRPQLTAQEADLHLNVGDRAGEAIEIIERHGGEVSL